MKIIISRHAKKKIVQPFSLPTWSIEWKQLRSHISIDGERYKVHVLDPVVGATEHSTTMLSHKVVEHGQVGISVSLIETLKPYHYNVL